jgi:hypothetical protein
MTRGEYPPYLPWVGVFKCGTLDRWFLAIGVGFRMS